MKSFENETHLPSWTPPKKQLCFMTMFLICFNIICQLFLANFRCVSSLPPSAPRRSRSGVTSRRPLLLMRSAPRRRMDLKTPEHKPSKSSISKNMSEKTQNCRCLSDVCSSFSWWYISSIFRCRRLEAGKHHKPRWRAIRNPKAPGHGTRHWDFPSGPGLWRATQPVNTDCPGGWTRSCYRPYRNNIFG